MADSPDLNQINRDFKEKSIRNRAKELSMEYVNISDTPLNPDLFQIISFEDAEKLKSVVFYRHGDLIKIATAEPESKDLAEKIEALKKSGFRAELFLASDDGILETIKHYTSGLLKQKKPISETKTVQIDDLESEIKGKTAIEVLDMICAKAHQVLATDIHFQPEGDGTIIRFRIDGVLSDLMKINNKLYKELSDQIKYRAKMKINIYDIPQDGRFSFEVSDQKIDVRVSSLPTKDAESFVLRLLDTQKRFVTLEDLGFSDYYLETLKNTYKLSSGMVLITGPTGSGKTSTLYTLISGLNSTEKKIITLEDPIEYQVSGITQSQINTEDGYTFSSGLKALLRQDPDIVMVGEIRDAETAKTAVQASITGHLMLSTIHTNDAVQVIPRLLNMDIPDHMLVSALEIVVAQRLIRKVCPNCATSRKITDSEREIFETSIKKIEKIHSKKLEVPEKIVVSNGCEKCNGLGYIGQSVIAEVVDFKEIKELILDNDSDYSNIRRQMISMLDDGVYKVINGETTIDEVFRVVNY